MWVRSSGATFVLWLMSFFLPVLPCLFLSLAPPRFTKVPVDQIGVSGGVVSFVCQATGDPKPRVSWNKKGKKVNSQRIEVSQRALLHSTGVEGNFVIVGHQIRTIHHPYASDWKIYFNHRPKKPNGNLLNGR